ncbi:F-box/WD repeat-containing protein 9 [Polyodon spathula]|uniref:F-box/WD repeat-containing protein 9 n=1 Tax=Polyodon spathula TaxID=7913 RepID=UPI001B7E6606|nr:F-box/WD repeat-containing protein 9 [Polyodon spathula]
MPWIGCPAIPSPLFHFQTPPGWSVLDVILLLCTSLCFVCRKRLKFTNVPDGGPTLQRHPGPRRVGTGPGPEGGEARRCLTTDQTRPVLGGAELWVSSAPETSPSCVHSAPSGEGSSLLLSLPWEVLLHLTSYLPACFVINVLSQVCRSLRALASDRLSWKLRAQRRLRPAGGGTSRAFPLLETPDFDWPAACLELEEHLSHWSDEGRGAERFSLSEGHFASVESVLLLNGGTVCASGSRDRNVLLWDLRRGRGTGGEGEVKSAPYVTVWGNQRHSSHQGWVWCLAAQGNLLCSGSFDSTIKTWDLGASGAPVSEIRGRDAVLCLSCLSDVVVAGSFDKRVSVYDPRCEEPLLQSLELHSRAVLSVSADERHIVSGSEDRSLAVFDRRAGKLLQRMQVPGPNTGAALAPRSHSKCSYRIINESLSRSFLSRETS